MCHKLITPDEKEVDEVGSHTGGRVTLDSAHSRLIDQFKRHMIRETIANWFISTGRSFGRATGLELAVEVSDHSIKCDMEKPDESTRAWDPDMYKDGNLFVSGYANPIKPRVDYHPDLEEPNTVDVSEGHSGTSDAERIASCDGCGPEDNQEAMEAMDGVITGDVDDERLCETHLGELDSSHGSHLNLISSGRYREYMRQDLISQLLTPESRWNLIVWAMIGLGVLQFLAIIVTLYATGSFQ